MNVSAKIITSSLFALCLSGQAFAGTPEQTVATFFKSMNSTTNTLLKQSAQTSATRELTPMLMLARTNWDSLTPATQALVSPWFLRPTDAGATSTISGVNFYGAAQTISKISTTHFIFHYLDAATYPTDANRATATFVNQLAIEAEIVWNQEVNTMGYYAPPSDGALGGDSRYDIYLINTGAARIYGYVTSDSTTYSPATPYPHTVYTHMVIDNDFAVGQFGYTNPLTPAKVTLAHEFFHSIQNAYDSSEYPAFLESLSTWMEDKVYPTIKDNLQYIGEVYVDADGNGQYSSGETFTDINGNNLRESGSQDYPEYSLDSFGLSANGLEQYGRFVWVRYLSDKFGDTLIKSILMACGTTAGNNTYAAINAALTPYASSLAAAFHEFGTWNINTSLYTNGAAYPVAWGDNLFNNGAINISSNASTSLQPFGGAQKHLSTVYELVNNPSGTYTFTTTGTALITAMIQATTGGNYTHQALAMSSGRASWTTNTAPAKVTFVISNTSATDDSMTWKLTDGITAPLPVLASTGTTIFSTSGTSGGCLTPNNTPLQTTLFLLLLLAYSCLKKRNPSCQSL